MSDAAFQLMTKHLLIVRDRLLGLGSDWGDESARRLDECMEMLERQSAAPAAHVAAEGARGESSPPIPMFLTCPMCSARHIDVGEFATKPHHTHACQTCGMAWRPAIVATVGVAFLPGFKDAPSPDDSAERARMRRQAAEVRELRDRQCTDPTTERLEAIVAEASQLLAECYAESRRRGMVDR